MSYEDDVLWTEACRTGERHYFTGRPCKNGHISKRYTNGRACVDCVSANTAKRNKGIKQMKPLFVTVSVYSADDQKAVIDFANMLNKLKVAQQ